MNTTSKGYMSRHLALPWHRAAWVAGLLLLSPLIAQTQDATAEKPKDAILILDASGSMWGQIDGVNKIVIAKDVVEGLVRALPPQQRLGLVAYGHRRESDCADIETLADVGAPRDDVIATLRELSPKGKTPLTRSVEHAATELDYTKKAATVVLVSDGLENCDADPCALAKTLEENGLDFTVHVIGFDVTEQERQGLQCIATETGGEFFAAGNANELTEALGKVAALEGAVTPSGPGAGQVRSTLAMKATILSGGPQIQSDLSFSVMPAGGGEAVFASAAGGAAETEITPGDYIVEATWTGWRKNQPDGGAPKKGRMAFSVNPQQPKVITVPIDLDIPVTLTAPLQTAEGVPFEVSWTGPDDLGAYVQVNRLDDSPRSAIYMFPTQRTRNAYAKSAADISTIDSDGDGDFDQDDLAVSSLGAPSIAGDYEVRYVLDNPRLILARVPLTVTDSVYTLEVPDEAPVSVGIDIAWSGSATDGDFVTLIEAGSEDVFRNGVTARVKTGEVARLTTPAVPGDYEVRYILANGYTLYPGMQQVVQTVAPIRVVDVAASIAGPASAVGGATIDVQWTGPADEKKDDFISVVTPGAEKPNPDSRTNVFARGGVMQERIPIRVPAIEGEYELVYFLQPGTRVLARTPISITRAAATVDAPETVRAGEDFQVSWSGDAFRGDRVVVTPMDTPDIKMWGWTPAYGFQVAEGESSGNVRGSKAIPRAGEYEVRYVTGLQHQVLARDRITVTE